MNFIKLFTIILLFSYCFALPLQHKIQQQQEQQQKLEQSIKKNNLGAYVIDKSKVFVSGLSAGAYMATQLHVAYSELFKGHGSLAGGPFYCAEADVGTALGACMASPALINVNSLISAAKTMESRGTIDSLSNLETSRNYIFHGKNDGTVAEGCSEALEEFMAEFANPSLMLVSYNTTAGHAHSTDDYGNSCESTRAPWINDCNYDATGVMLRHMYSPTPINSRVNQIPANLMEFDQDGDFASPSTSDTGYVYVPTACQNGATCSLHVALHGCKQYHENPSVGKEYVTHAGYNEYAEANNIIILYPQAIDSISPYNPNGCWDWWGYASTDYAEKSGPQMAAIKAMIDQLMSGAPPLDSPSAPKIEQVSDNSIFISWTAVDEASSYDVYRNNAKVNSNSITSTVYNDTGLQSGTQYSYTIVAKSSNGGVSSPSAATLATTSGSPPPLGAPEGLTVTDTTSTTVTLSWTTLNGASRYIIYRNNGLVGNVTTTTFTDLNLQPETTYTYYINGVTSSGTIGPQSSTVQATTGSSWQCEEFYDSNYDHERAGRAYQVAGLCYAVGSDEYMGLWNVGAMTRLAETSSNYFIVGEC